MTISSKLNISPRQQHILVIVLIAITTALRMWFSATHELLQDEAYYWQWSRHLDWGYYDNTPFMAVVIRVFTTLFGTSSITVRAGAMFSAIAVSVFIYMLALRFTDRTTAVLSVMLATILPLFAVGSVIMTQDPVQLMFWTATLWFAADAISGKRFMWWVAGAMAGLTAMSKLNGLLVMPAVLLYLILDPIARRTWLKRPEPYIAGCICLVMFFPFVFWNHSHHNAFWHHISAMGTRSSSTDPFGKWFLRFLGDQAVEWSPGLFVIFLWAMMAPRMLLARIAPKSLLLWCAAAVVFGATALLSLNSKVEGNWPVAAYPTGIILAAAVIHYLLQKRSPLINSLLAGSAALAILTSTFLLVPEPFYRAGIVWGDPTLDRSNELYGWSDLASRVGNELSREAPNTFVFSVNYKVPSELAFYLTGRPKTYSLFLHDRPSEYEFWENQSDLIGRDGLFVIEGDSVDRLTELQAVFDKVEVLRPCMIYRPFPYGNRPIRTLQLVHCIKFHGYNVKDWVVGY